MDGILKKNKKIILVILSIVILAFSIYNALFRPTRLNSFIASKIYRQPANKAFIDDYFYKCVVDSYNSQNKSSVAYTENLTNEQLENIERLSCGYKLNNIAGIGKLKSLKSLYIYFFNDKALDLSQNLLLEELYIEKMNLDVIDLKNNRNLKSLRVNGNNLKTIDLSQNILLEDINVSDNHLETIDLKNNRNLKNLKVRDNKLKAIDLSNNKELLTLNITNNDLDELDVSVNLKLLELLIDDNKLKAIDLSNNKELLTLSIMNNDLDELDVSNNLKLLELLAGNKDSTIVPQSFEFNSLELQEKSIYRNKLKTINLSNNKQLYYLNLGGNLFDSLDISNNKDLETLYAYSNNLKFLDLSNNQKLMRLVIHNNKLETIDLSNFNYFADLTIYDNPFNEDIVIYKDEDIDDPKTKIFNKGGVKLSTDAYSDIISINLNDQSTNYIDTSKPGYFKYDITKEYSFSVYSINLNLHVVELTSNKYKIDSMNNYIYTGIDTNPDVILSNIKLNYGDAVIKNNKLIIKYDGVELKSFDILNIEFNNLIINGNSITIDLEMPYNKFIDNIKLSDKLSYKIFNDSSEIKDGYISKNMVINLYYDGTKLDSFNIIDNCLKFDESLKIDEVKKYISDVNIGTDVKKMLSKINTNGSITIKKNNKKITSNDLVGTGVKVVIKFVNETKEYTVIVKGDVTGDGISSVSDVAKLYQYLKGKIEMEDYYLFAGNVVNSDNEIKINDVAKLYQFIKNKISGLED